VSLEVIARAPFTYLLIIALQVNRNG